jgi:hypothetical protein
LLGDYELINNELNWVDDNDVYSYSYERFSFGGVLTARFLDNFIQPSIFYKRNYWGDDQINIGAIGTDILFLLTQVQTLYIGYSLRENTYTDDNVPSFEIGTYYNNSHMMLDIKYFSNEYFYETSLEAGWGSISQNFRGIGLGFNYKFWLLLLETNSFYYFDAEQKRYFEVQDEQPKNLPKWQIIGGLYVNDMFFDDNLDLKAGFKFSYTGEILSVEDYYYNGTVVEPTNKLDFNLAGEIQKVAIFYFQWENLFGNEYYITPYYPMPVRNIKFGIAWELFN